MTLLLRSRPRPAHWSRVSGLKSWLPSRCQICQTWPAAPLCDMCVSQFGRVQACCERCALPLSGGARVCGACLRDPPPMESCFSAVVYQWPWTECLARFKFRQDTGLAGSLAALMLRTPGVPEALAGADITLPLPLSPQRLAERGYNQSLLLARALPAPGLHTDLLIRTRHTSPQRAMTREQRLKSLRGAFAVNTLRTSAIRGRRVILVDDVMTTGATLNAAASALRAAGAAHITALVVARTAL